jgi:acyl-[acyl-carrier-protein]-phospholipid O-acyltransferase / long-chain-fatty-acid--[acyl-carrier-protein] ligase
MPHFDSGRMPPDFVRLNIAQFCGALIDNIFKLFAMLFLIRLQGSEDAASITATASAIFVLPFLLFSAAAGVLADRYSKRTVLVASKVFELAVMLAAVLAFQRTQPLFLYAILFLISLQSTLYGPSKYGIVPELVLPAQLSRANSLLVMFTFLAIIAGTALAPLALDLTGGNYSLAQTVCIAASVAGLIATLGIRRTPPAGSTARIHAFFIRDIWRTLWSIRQDRYLVQAVLASAYFMMLGAYLQLNMIPYGIQHLGLTEQGSGYLFFVVALGVATGAFLAGKLSGRNIEFGIVPLGAALLTLSTVGLKFLPSVLGLVVPAVFAAGVGAGLFVVPVDSFIQSKAPPEKRGEILAAAGFISWLGVLAAAALVLVTVRLAWSAATGFLLLGALTFALALFTLWILPDFLLRFLLLLVTRCAYRIRVIGNEHLPADGPAVLVCNHVSYMDALLLVATQQRRLRFLLPSSFYNGWRWARPFFDLMKCIPVDSDGPPKQLAQALDRAKAALAEGYMVCVFAEDAMTRTGNIRAFHRGCEFLVKDTDYPVHPVYIGGAWGAFTSYHQGRLRTRWGGFRRYPVTVLFGEAMPSTSSAGDVRAAVMELSCDYYQDRKSTRRPLGLLLAQTARARWNRPAIADSTGKRLTYGHMLTATVALAGKLRPLTRQQDRIGILLPTSVGGALANLAVALLGKTSVNLNFTASHDSIRSAMDQCGLATVVTSKAFLERFPELPLPPHTLFIEDLVASISGADKRRAFLMARLLPLRALAGVKAFTPDRIAAILFSSGSTGEPKGIMLSHHNIQSNIESLRAVFASDPSDNVCAALPFFHSLGFTGTLWFPLLSGFSAAYHPNPLEGAAIAQLARENRSTLLFATPTFLLLYLRKASKEDFATLKFVVVGAEKLKERLAVAFEEKFGIRPLEGYGATELAPVAALSLPHAEGGGIRQAGWKEGSVGMPLPGVAMKVVDPDTGRPLPVGEAGLLLVKGPNVMVGYLNQPERTAEVLKDGWYHTGDMARIDKDGFVAITDRLSRFSKIGGEMVPHLGIEDALHKQLGASGQVLAIVGAPDEKKGEKLVLLYTDEAGEAGRIHQAIEAADIPNLWKPARGACFRIDAIPVLGTGKVDLKSLKELAKARIDPPAAGEPDP